MAKQPFYDERGRLLFEGDEDCLDGRGLLRDGKSVRIPIYVRDGATVDDAAAALQNLDIKDRAAVLADIGARFGHRSGYAFADGGDATTLKAAARLDYANSLGNAWRRQTTDNRPGDDCMTHDGRPGRLSRDGGKLVCRPLAAESKEPSDRVWQIAGPLSDAESVALKDTALKEYEARLTSAGQR